MMSGKDANVSQDDDIIELNSNSKQSDGRNLSLTSDGPLYEKQKRKASVTSVTSTASSKSRKFLLFPFKYTGTSNGSIRRRWRSVRHAVRVTNAVSMRKGISREDSFLKKFSTRQPYRADSVGSLEENIELETTKNETSKKISVLHPDGKLMFYWLGVVTVAVMYNLWTCIAREAFREIQEGHMNIWISFDILCDTVFIIDIIVQFRTGYLDQGIMVYNSAKLAHRYVTSKFLLLDLICLLPLDFLQFYVGVHAMLRFPRFIKAYRTFRFMYMLESRTQFPNFFRVANLTHILFLGSHWFAAFYYLISEAENFEGDWSYPKPTGQFASVTRKYLASLFWSTLTLTTIGDLPPPESNWEYVFVIVSYLIGVFIFATIVGQVGNVITNRNASRQEFERLLDGAKMYMRMNNVPPELQKRVQRWYDYVWTRGRMKGSDINSLGLLPDKLKTELAIHVNLETLKKVTIFQECQPEFLHDLVLKMKAYIFTPGDLICRTGEVAREMFIIADGLVEIISESGTVLTQMGTGDFFGEIGILNLDGGINRRTADVKSVGYSELFVLSREDVLSALKDHPEAEQIIREYGQQRLKEIEQHRQKLKESNSMSSISRQKWSPSSPCKHFHVVMSPKRKRKSSNSHSGIKIADININISPISKQKPGIFTAMKTLVSKTKDKRQDAKPQSTISEEDDEWPVIARLTHGEVLAGNCSNSQNQFLKRVRLTKSSSESSDDSNKNEYFLPAKGRLESVSSEGLNTQTIEENDDTMHSVQEKDDVDDDQEQTLSRDSHCSSTNKLYSYTHPNKQFDRENSTDRQQSPLFDVTHSDHEDSARQATSDECCCPHIQTQITNLQHKLDNFDLQYGKRLNHICSTMDKQARYLEKIVQQSLLLNSKEKVMTDTVDTSQNEDQGTSSTDHVDEEVEEPVTENTKL